MSWVGKGAGRARGAKTSTVRNVADETGVAVMASLDAAFSGGRELSQRASLAFIGWFVIILASETFFTGRRARKGMPTVWTGNAIVVGPNGESILRAKFNVGAIIRGSIAGRGSLAHTGTVGVRVLALSSTRVARGGCNTHRC